MIILVIVYNQFTYNEAHNGSIQFSLYNKKQE